MPTPAHPRDRAVVLVSLTLVQVFFGLHYLAAKIVLREFEPRAWALVRVTGGALVVSALAVALRRPWPRRPRTWAALLGCSVLGVTLNQVLFIEGLARTTVTHSAMINTTIPVGALAFAVLLGRERASARKAFAIAVSLAGVLLIVRPWDTLAGTGPLAGDLLTVGNAAVYALFLVLSKRVLAGEDPLAATAVLMIFGVLGIGAYGGGALLRVDPAALSARALWLGAFIVVGPTAGSYALSYVALRRTDSSVVALFTYLQPFVAAVLGWLVLGERPSAIVYAGGALIFAGVGIAITSAGPRVRAATAGSGTAA